MKRFLVLAAVSSLLLLKTSLSFSQQPFTQDGLDGLYVERANALNEGLIARWTFDNVSTSPGSTVPDVTGNGHDGIIEGIASVTAGQIGDALDCSGTGRVRVPNHPALSGMSELTLACWYRLNG